MNHALGPAQPAVSLGFDDRDFRTNEGAPVIDPEAYWKLKTEAAASRTKRSKTLYFLAVALFVSFLLIVVGIAAAVPENTPKNVFLAICWGLFGGVVFGFMFIDKILVKRADLQTAALVEKHKDHFREAYGIELGFWMPDKPTRWGKDESYVYLRRPRRNYEDLESQVAKEGNFPPIFILRVIPGDLFMAAYDPTMRVDMKTWELLHSTMRERIRSHPFLKYLILAFALFLVVYSLAWPFLMDEIGIGWGYLILVFACSAIGFLAHLEDKRNLRIYGEVAQEVSQVLLEDEDGQYTYQSNLAVEFHTSELPGRPKAANRRFQFVLRDHGKSFEADTNEIV